MEGSLQAKLLKVLEDGAVRRLGALRPRRVDVRILAAANQDLEAAVRDGTFRADLLYRLRVLTVNLPPLRGRVEDIELLCAEFLRTTRERYGLGDVQLAPATQRALADYSWPGNVRELRHVIERAALLHGAETILPEHLGLTSQLAARATVQAREVSVDFGRGPIDLEAVERELITRALGHAAWNRARAAELLGLTRETLRYRIEKYGLRPDGLPRGQSPARPGADPQGN